MNLRKGCSLLGSSADWATRVVYAESDCLRKAREGAFEFPNFLLMADIFNLVDFLGWDIEFALLAFAPFLFSLGLPSDALLRSRDFRGDPIGGRLINLRGPLLAFVPSWKGAP